MIETTIQHLASCQCTGARRRYVHVSLRCHLCGLTPDGNVCMYVAQTEQPEGLEKVSAGKRDAEEMVTTTIEQITKRRRMTAVEREALQISCDRCGKQFSRPQDLKRHNSLMPQCGTVKRRMTVAERAKLPFKCETCGERFSRQQDIARHKCSSSSRTTSSVESQTK